MGLYYNKRQSFLFGAFSLTDNYSQKTLNDLHYIIIVLSRIYVYTHT